MAGDRFARRALRFSMLQDAGNFQTSDGQIRIANAHVWLTDVIDVY